MDKSDLYNQWQIRLLFHHTSIRQHTYSKVELGILKQQSMIIQLIKLPAVRAPSGFHVDLPEVIYQAALFFNKVFSLKKRKGYSWDWYTVIKHNRWQASGDFCVCVCDIKRVVLTGLLFSEASAFTPITESVNSFSTCWISSPVALGFSSRC